MSTRRSSETTPDLFSAPLTAKAPEPLPVRPSQPRHFLPKDLAGALKRLDNAEIDALLAAVTIEAERRSRQPPSQSKTDARLQSPQTRAVRAAFKAGVKPSAIARQFGISQADVRKALATKGWEPKSNR